MPPIPVNRKAKIVATIGPSSQEEPVLRRLIEAGVDVARLNFSHGTHAEHQEKIERIRRLSAELNKPVCILQDLQGPKLRVGKLPAGGIELAAGQSVALTNVESAQTPATADGEAITLGSLVGPEKTASRSADPPNWEGTGIQGSNSPACRLWASRSKAISPARSTRPWALARAVPWVASRDSI